MYCQAAFWFLLPVVTHNAIDPLTPGAALGPAGVGATATLPTTLDWAASSAAACMYVQLSANAAPPAVKTLRTSSSSDSSELGLVSFSSSVFFMNSSAARPPPELNAMDLPSADRNVPPNAPTSWV